MHYVVPRNHIRNETGSVKRKATLVSRALKREARSSFGQMGAVNRSASQDTPQGRFLTLPSQPTKNSFKVAGQPELNCVGQIPTTSYKQNLPDESTNGANIGFLRI